MTEKAAEPIAPRDPAPLVNDLQVKLTESVLGNLPAAQSVAGLTAMVQDISEPAVPVDGSTGCKRVDELFRTHQGRRSIVVRTGNGDYALLTHKHFRGSGGGPYAWALHADTPIQNLLEDCSPLVLEPSTTIAEASDAILGRDAAHRNDDALVVWPAGDRVAILSVFTLLEAVVKALQEGEERFRTVLNGAPIVMWATDRNGVITLSEGKALSGLGFRPGQLVGVSIFDIYRDRPDILSRYRRTLAGEESRSVMEVDGVALETLLQPMREHGNGDVVGIIGVSTDITEMRRAEKALGKSQIRHKAILESALDCIIAADHEGKIIEFNPAAQRVFGFSRAEALGRGLTETIFPAALKESLLRRFTNDPGSRARGARGQRIELSAARADGSAFPAEVTISIVELDEQPVFTAFVRDITQRKRLEEQLTHQAFHDPLTGLANRTLFKERVEHALERDRNRIERAAVLFLDLDDFKTVNDSMGHGTGDDLLIMVAQRLNRLLRPGDTFARLGGDEFAILLEDVRDLREPRLVAERILGNLRYPFELQGKEFFVGCSIGLGISGSGLENADELLRNADVAMYTAKNAGKGGCEVFQPEMHSAALKRLDLKAGSRRALERGEFVVHYQPILELGSNRVDGFEALVRWNHPQWGLLPPAQFTPLAEETGLIVEMGAWVFQEATRQAALWQATHATDPPLSMSVNISATQLHRPGFTRSISEILAQSGLDPGTLVLEVTESILVSDAQTAQRSLKELKALGLLLAIDDFGRGYSSLEYLRRLPIDILKVDKSFIDTVIGNTDESALARAIIKLGATLKLKVIAEGIETAAQVDRLKVLKCNWGQGYLFAKPLTADEAGTYLSAQALLDGRATGVGVD